MSLIHQALKKLETKPTEVSQGEAAFFGTVKGPYSKQRIILAVSLAVGSILLAALLYRIINVSSPTKTIVNVTAPTVVMPSREETSADKGVHLFRAGLFTEAIKEFEAAISRAPDDPVLHNNIALVYMKLGRNTEAEAAFKKALKLKPDYAHALNNYASYLDSRGQYPSAMGLFKKAMRMDPQYPDPHINIAITLEKLGKTSEAVSHYERFLAMGPSDPLLMEDVRKKINRLKTNIAVGGRGG